MINESSIDTLTASGKYATKYATVITRNVSAMIPKMRGMCRKKPWFLRLRLPFDAPVTIMNKKTSNIEKPAAHNVCPPTG